MISVEQSIEVNAPVGVVYDQWTRFEEYPKFMSTLRDVLQVDETHYYWRSEREGKTFESFTEICLTIPERRIAWRTVSGVEMSGVVEVEPESETSTRVILKTKYAPDAGWPSPEALARRLGQHLQNFKAFIESVAVQNVAG